MTVEYGCPCDPGVHGVIDDEDDDGSGKVEVSVRHGDLNLHITVFMPDECDSSN